MFRLERIVLSNWGRLEPQDIEVQGSVAILGPTGAGKSTIIDALQVVITGANSRFFDLNKSTGGTNTRTIRDYCLGADDHISTLEPARDAADTIVGLCFRDVVTGRPVSIGIIFNATVDEPKESIKARFVARDYALALAELIETRADGRRVVPVSSRVLEQLKERCRELRLHGSGGAFVDDYLLAMRRRGAAPDAKQVLRNFKEAIAFRPIDDPTEFVRKHILEEDDIDVGALKDSIERYRYLESQVQVRERQLREIASVRGRFQTWATHVIRENALLFTVAHADRLRLALVISRLQAQREELARTADQERDAKKKREQWILDAQDDIQRKKLVLADGPEELRLRGLEAEKKGLLEQQKAAGEAARNRVAGLIKLVNIGRSRANIPIRLQDGLDAAAELVEVIRGKNVEDLLASDDRLAAIERRMMVLLEAETSLAQQEQSLAEQIASNRQKLEDLESRLDKARSGAILSTSTNDFIALLAKEGIDALPLPEAVEITDPIWAMALEMLLGPNREALIIRRDRIADAYSLLYRERRSLHRCRLVDTRKTARWNASLPPRSIAEIVNAQNDDARVFIERQVGRFVRAETDADLERLEQAVTKRGKTTSGMALRVFDDLEPILGKTAQQRAARVAQEQLAALSSAQKETMSKRDALRGALFAIASLKDQSPTALTDAISRLAEISEGLRGNAAAQASAISPESQAIRDEIDGIDKEIRGWRQEIHDVIDRKIESLNREDTELQVNIKGHQNSANAREEEEERAKNKEAGHPIVDLRELLESQDTIAAAEVRVSIALDFTPEGRDRAARLSDLVAEAKRDAEQLPRLADESARRGRNGYLEFVTEHVGAPPLRDPDDLEILRWCMVRERQLEDDELRRYRQEFEAARAKMEADLTEGLINRLNDKFQKARAQIERLNRSLAGRKFTGQTYAFQYRLNEAMRPIHALAQAIAEAPRRGLQILEDRDLDPKVRQGFKELERRLDDDNLIKDLQDYRKFFDFDLSMTNERNEQTTLSKRSGTGSGGQKQAPYYVAVGAAMASAYYPKSSYGEPEGLGLVVFDEAFNNLDAPNTKALFDFFNAVHLQVVVAAPDKVRAMFLETVDTIVSINRRPDTLEPVATVTHPSARARLELSRANPVNLGVDAFREQSQAAQ